MKLVRIEADAEAYYSGQTWHEETYLFEDDYEKYKEIIENISIYVSELDGKYSETEAELTITVVDEKDFEKYQWDTTDNYLLVETMGCEVENCEELYEVIDKAEEYAKSIDGMEEVTIRIKKSNRARLEKFLEELKTD